MSVIMPAKEVVHTGRGLTPNPFTERWAATSPSDTREEALSKEMAFQNAQKISRQIDEGLLESKKVMDKKKKAAQILLLGAYTKPSSPLLSTK
jgi:guanine nucleotide-binding protein subunit alpha